MWESTSHLSAYMVIAVTSTDAESLGIAPFTLRMLCINICGAPVRAGVGTTTDRLKLLHWTNVHTNPILMWCPDSSGIGPAQWWILHYVPDKPVVGGVHLGVVQARCWVYIRLDKPPGPVEVEIPGKLIEKIEGFKQKLIINSALLCAYRRFINTWEAVW